MRLRIIAKTSPCLILVLISTGAGAEGICNRNSMHAFLAAHSHRAPTPRPNRKTGRTPLASNNSAHWRCGRCRKQTTELRTRKGRRRSRCASKAATKAHTKQPPPFPFPPSPCHPLPLHPGHCEVTHAGHPIEKQDGPGFASFAGFQFTATFQLKLAIGTTTLTDDIQRSRRDIR